MKRKLLITVMLLALTVSSAGYAFAGTAPEDAALKPYLTDIYKLLAQLLGGGQEPGAQEQEPGGQGPGGQEQEPGDSQVQSQTAQVLALVNQERQNAGLKALTTDTKLTKVAQLKAEDMAKNKYFSHNSPLYGSAFDMLRDHGINYTSAGENIARGQKDARSVMKAWMASSGHKANILKPQYEKLGVGLAYDESGRSYWVQIFIS